MALITKPPAWAYCTTTLTGNPVNGYGTSITAGANNADGSSVGLLTAIAHDVEYLIIHFSGFNTSTANGSTLLDVLTDPAGGSSWGSTPLISDLLVGYTNSPSTTVGMGGSYHFPIWVKSGSSIGVRARTAHTATIAGRIHIYAFGGNANPGSWWCGQQVETIGVTAASSQGTNHTAGASTVFSSWTDFGSTLSYQTGAIQWAVQGTNTDTSANGQSYYFEFGVGSTRIGPQIFKSTSNVEGGWGGGPPGPIFCNLAPGTQLQVRGTSNGAAPEALDVAAYAVS